MENRYTLIVGDEDIKGDANHGIRTMFQIKSNAEDIDQLKKSYDKGVQITGVDIYKMCKGYRQLDITVDTVNQIKQKATNNAFEIVKDKEFLSSFEHTSFYDENYWEEGYWEDYFEEIPEPEIRWFYRLDWEAIYFVLWRATALIGNPNLKIELNKNNETLYIGGYGIFDREI